MDTVVVVDLIKGRATPWPRIDSDTHLMTAGSARPLEDALRIAQADLVQWVSDDHGLSLMDAYQLMSQAVESPLATCATPTTPPSPSCARTGFRRARARSTAYTPGLGRQHRPTSVSADG